MLAFILMPIPIIGLIVVVLVYFLLKSIGRTKKTFSVRKEKDLSLTNYSIIDLWYQAVIEGENIEDKDFIFTLKQECPGLISTVFERWCNLQCIHCFYEMERATASQCDTYGIEDILQTLVKQVSQSKECHLLHAGRILREWHIPVLRNIQKTNPGVKIGLIDNGSYTKLINKIILSDLLFNWIDISLDGTPEIHNKQRDNSNAFRVAQKGLSEAKNILKKDGKLTALFTLTTINSHSVGKTVDIALEYAHEFHLSPISPRTGQQHLVSSVLDIEKMWNSIVNAVKIHGREKIIIRMYHASDFEKLSHVVGHKTVSQSLKSALVIPETAGLLLDIENICVSFFPSSLWPKEEIIVDADGSYRMGHNGQFTLSELQSGRSRFGQDTLPYTISKLDKASRIVDLYPKCIETWWSLLGKDKLHKEIEVFQTIMKGGDKF